MTRGRFAVLLAAFGLVSVGSAQAWSINKTVVAGKTIVLAGYMSINEDCSSMGEVVVRITTQPTHGVAVAKKGVFHPAFPRENVRSACNVRALPSLNLEYHAASDYTGSDYVSVEIIYPSGADKTEDFAIEVK